MTTSPLRPPLSRQGSRRLVAVVATMVVIWLVILPLLASYPPVARWVEWLDERRIDPSAMYYTELEVMKPVLVRINRGDRSPITPATEVVTKQDEVDRSTP